MGCSALKCGKKKGACRINFEWQKSYAMQFGLIAIDRAGDLARTPKPSLAHLGGFAG